MKTLFVKTSSSKFELLKEGALHLLKFAAIPAVSIVAYICWASSSVAKETAARSALEKGADEQLSLEEETAFMNLSVTILVGKCLVALAYLAVATACE